MFNKLLTLVRKDDLVKQNTILFAGTMTLNILNYVYHFLVGRLLGPADYGILGAFFSIIYILFAPINTIQTTLAKFTANFAAKNETGKVVYIYNRALKLLSYVSLVVFLIFFAFSPQIGKFLLIDNIIYLSFNLYGALTAISIALLVSFLFAFYFLKKNLSVEAVQVDGESIYKYTLPVLVTMTVITAIYTIDVVLVKHFFDPVTAGLY